MCPKAENFEISLSTKLGVFHSALCGLKGILRDGKHSLLSNACSYKATEAI